MGGIGTGGPPTRHRPSSVGPGRRLDRTPTVHVGCGPRCRGPARRRPDQHAGGVRTAGSPGATRRDLGDLCADRWSGGDDGSRRALGRRHRRCRARRGARHVVVSNGCPSRRARCGRSGRRARGRRRTPSSSPRDGDRPSSPVATGRCGTGDGSDAEPGSPPDPTSSGRSDSRRSTSCAQGPGPNARRRSARAASPARHIAATCSGTPTCSSSPPCQPSHPTPRGVHSTTAGPVSRRREPAPAAKGGVEPDSRGNRRRTERR